MTRSVQYLKKDKIPIKYHQKRQPVLVLRIFYILLSYFVVMCMCVCMYVDLCVCVLQVDLVKKIKIKVEDELYGSPWRPSQALDNNYKEVHYEHSSL